MILNIRDVGIEGLRLYNVVWLHPEVWRILLQQPQVN